MTKFELVIWCRNLFKSVRVSRIVDSLHAYFELHDLQCTRVVTVLTFTMIVKNIFIILPTHTASV